MVLRDIPKLMDEETSELEMFCAFPAQRFFCIRTFGITVDILHFE